MAIRTRLPLTLTLILLTLVACQSSPASRELPTPHQTSSETQPATSAPRRDLSQDEAAGGHTLKKHIGRIDEQLGQRLRQERNISAASTYTDLDSAEVAVGTAIQQNQAKIDRWLNRQGGHPNLVIDYDGDPAHPIGRTMHRGDDQSQPCSRALVVLKWDGGRDYHVLTTYPECR